MTTQENNEFNKMLSGALTHESLDMQVPPLSGFSRDLILARRKVHVEKTSMIDSIFSFIRFELKLYHLGLTAVMMLAGIFYLTMPTYNSSDVSTFGIENSLSITNNTISVNSTTMLTSIPTMVIRN